MRFKIRRLTQDDTADYRALRLEALRDLPEAFFDSFKEADARPEGYWTALFEGDFAYFGAFDATNLVGIVHTERKKGEKAAHKSWLYGMYVRADMRGSGCAQALVGAVLDHAKQDGAAQVQLGVSAKNDRARKLYEKAGFVPYGREPRGLKIGDTFVDQVFMVKFLDNER